MIWGIPLKTKENLWKLKEQHNQNSLRKKANMQDGY